MFHAGSHGGGQHTGILQWLPEEAHQDPRTPIFNFKLRKVTWNVSQSYGPELSNGTLAYFLSVKKNYVKKKKVRSMLLGLRTNTQSFFGAFQEGTAPGLCTIPGKRHEGLCPQTLKDSNWFLQCPAKPPC